MKRAFLTPALFVLLIAGCCTSKNDAPETNANDVVPVADQAAQAAEMKAFTLPYTLELSAAPDGDDMLLTATVTYHETLSGAPKLHIDLRENTILAEGLPDVSLDKPIKGQKTAKTFRLRGASPAAEVTVSLQDEGFGLEVHEAYPPQIEKNAVSPEIRHPLPAPIEVDGTIIQSGVEVTP